jgi:peptidyl-tRNA hydrolase
LCGKQQSVFVNLISKKQRFFHVHVHKCFAFVNRFTFVNLKAGHLRKSIAICKSKAFMNKNSKAFVNKANFFKKSSK